MGEPTRTGTPQIERALVDLFASPDPEPVFVASLERRLLAQAEAMPHRIGTSRAPSSWSGWLDGLRRHRAMAVAAGLLMILALAVAAIGPARVVAAIQDLVGYVPGIGFVDLEATRLLAAPVEVTRDGVTLRVEQAIAGPDNTKIVVRSEGLPPEDLLWPDGAEQQGDFAPLLRLPDGRTLTTATWTLRLGGGTLEFPSLPDGVYRVKLELPRLPLVPTGAAPENWQVPLDLRPATGDLVTDLFAEPYAPAGAEETHHEITLRVLAVAHSAEETVVRVQVQWPNPDWEWPTIGYNLPVLRDNLGHEYHHAPASSTGSSVQTEVIRIPDPQQITPTPTPELPTDETTQTFAAVSPSAGQLALWVDAVSFAVPAEASFVVDLGDAPQVGDRWPLDISLTVAGFPVNISGARLVQEELELRDGTVQQTLLQFDLDSVPDQDGRMLRHIGLAGDQSWFSGTTGGYEPQSRTIRTGLELVDGTRIPGGPTEVRVERADVVFHGPWILTWSIPGAGKTDGTRAAPVVRHPANAVQSRQGLTLRASQVVQTDRLAAITVELDDPPPGFLLNRVWGWNPATKSSDLYLADERGRRYELTNGVTWRPGDERPW
ncbi:MAG: hypothetical protein GX597_02050, partial [Anaerolineaceae bacterium]|nr:hypothetical protein [Anaerolineaceae bacterium]